MTEVLTFVDENDNPIGSGDRKEAWAKGLYTRNVRIVIRDENGRILSQKRSFKKDSYPGMWTVAASGHVDAGEEWDIAAARETAEEIGIEVDVKEVGRFNFADDSDGKKVRQVLRVYEGTIDSSTNFVLDPDEVEDTKWYELDDLKAQMQSNPSDFTPSFHETIARFYASTESVENIIFADENDHQIGSGPREEAWQNGYYVRIVRAILRDEQGRILSQHRSSQKKSYPNCWTDSASGHVDDGETYDFAMKREMKEEIGFETDLTFIGKFASQDIIDGKKIFEFNAIYEGSTDSSVKLVLQESEVSEVKWFELSELKSMIEHSPSQFTLGMREAIRLFY